MNENTLFTHYFYKLWVKIKIIFSKNNDQDCVQVNAEMVLRSDSSPTAVVRALGMWTGFSILFNVFLVLVDLLHLSFFFLITQCKYKIFVTQRQTVKSYLKGILQCFYILYWICNVYDLYKQKFQQFCPPERTNKLLTQNSFKVEF